MRSITFGEGGGLLGALVDSGAPESSPLAELLTPSSTPVPDFDWFLQALFAIPSAEGAAASVTALTGE